LIDERVVSTEEGADYAMQKDVIFYETSAKTGEKVVDVMNELAKVILEEKEKVKVLAEKPVKPPTKEKTGAPRFLRRLFK